MTRRPTMDEIEAGARPEREAPPDTLTYWQKRDEWARLGREVGALRIKAKADGVPLEMLPGANRLVARFKHLGQELDRRTR